MPRISAASIGEHVALQTTRILDAAETLFRQRGYRGTELEAIAESVGLARNSIYRYYPGKDHILVACVQRAMQKHLSDLQGIEARFPDPAARVAAWIRMQIDIATGPQHATMELMREVRNADPELRREIMALHMVPAEILQRAVDALVRGRRRDAVLLTAMVNGMTEAAASRAIDGGNRAAVLRELQRAAQRLLEE